MKIQLILLPMFILIAVFFQNCSPFSFSNENRDVASYSGSGQPYDGKLFVLDGQCASGESISDRIKIAGKSAIVTRENCVDLDPARLLTPESWTVVSSGLQYNGKSYREERPESPVPMKTSWFIQLQGQATPRPVSYVEVDLHEATSQTMAALRAGGAQVICNISAGTLESWRSDAGSFQSADIGNSVTGAAGERWLNIRSASVRSVLLNRIRTGVSKGCEIFDFDAIDGYQNSSGFSLSRADQLAYIEFLAFAVHNWKKQAAFHSVADLVREGSGLYDLAITEQCSEQGTCGAFQVFSGLGKAVLSQEYVAKSAALCEQAQRFSQSLIFVNRELDGQRFETCD